MGYTNILLLVQITVLHAINPVKLGFFPVKRPGFTSIYKTTDPQTNKTSYDLLISSFDPIPFSKDSVYIVRDIGRFMDSVSDIKPEKLTDKLSWPNEIAGVPRNVFNRSMVAIPDGFLVPFKTKGSIQLLDLSGSASPVRITEESGQDWFYHRVRWVDMDSDGDYDALTCRARKPAFGSETGELLWYENPSSVRPNWTPHILAKGPDVYFNHYRLNTSEGFKDCIFTAQFFTKSLSVYWTENSDWTDPTKVRSRVIDNTIGAVFDVQVNDIANDGNLNLLVTTNDEKNGTVLAYDIPDDFRTGAFIRHVLATGFRPRESGTGRGSPGSAVPIKYIVPPYKRPFIVSGDDDGRAYVLLCTSYDWTYSLNTFLDVGKGTIGQIAIEDVNEDYKLDVFIPAYNEGLIYVYQYNP